MILITIVLFIFWFFFVDYSITVFPSVQPEMKNPKIVVFHVWPQNSWKEIVKKLVDSIISSGLYDQFSSFYIGTSGDGTIVDTGQTVMDYLEENYPDKKFKLLYATDYRTYENTTINAAIDLSRTIDETNILYIHNKGTMNDRGGNYWIESMMTGVIENWRGCADLLDSGYLTAGINFSLLWDPMYSGNFWWSRSSHLAVAEKIYIKSNTNGAHSSRYPAEKVVLKQMQPGKHANIGRVFNNFNLMRHDFSRE